MAVKEYPPGSAFPGHVGRTVEQSEPAWPAPVRAKPGAPNVLFVVFDDMGFAQLGCYGSPIATPNVDRLAASGLLFTSMHTTPLCSPTRSCILTGRNHHANGMAAVVDLATGFPGSNGLMPFENGMLSEMLLPHGYNTYAVGKWHLVRGDHATAAGPYDRWPLGRGFERYYGFLGGDTHQYYPELVYDNHQVPPPLRPEQGYHLTTDLVDHAIRFVADAKQVARDKPFFLNFAPGAMHAPHHVPRAWADRYAGAFDDGWDVYRERTFERQKQLGIMPRDAVLSRHDPDVQEWATLPARERRLYARMMEVYAGFLEHTDAELGRLLGYLQEIGQLDNTLLMLISDNGASAEGGPHGSVNENVGFNNVPESLEQNLAAIEELGGPRHFNHYPRGWAHAGDTPFRRWKRETYRGGVADPFIVHWPKGLRARGEMRHQYAHAIDMVPTVLDCLGLEPPTEIRGVRQSPLHGVSFAHCLDDAAAPSRHRTQYFEMMGHRAIYHDGWRAVCPVPGPSYAEAGLRAREVIDEQRLRELDRSGWELYHVAVDSSESRDVAREEPGRLIELVALWYLEAGRYGALPLDNRGMLRVTEERPKLTGDVERYVYRPGTAAVAEEAAARVLNRAHSITARVELSDGASGVIVAHGGSSGGYSLFVKDRRLHYVQNYVGLEELHVESRSELPDGEHELRFEFEPTGAADLAHGKGTPGKAQLYVDRRLVAEETFPVTIPLQIGITEGLTVGRDELSGVSRMYRPPFTFTGGLRDVVIEVEGPLIEDPEAEARNLMARQ